MLEVGVLAFVKKLVDAVRFARGKDTNALVTQLFVWVAGVGAVWVGANTDLGGMIEFANLQLDQVSLWGQAVLGVLLGSVASTVKDALKALDNNQTESAPHLLRNRAEDSHNVR